MEKRERFVIELLLGIILVVFLFLLVFLVIGISKAGKVTGQTIIIEPNNVDAQTSNVQQLPPYLSVNERKPIYYSHRYVRADTYYTRDDFGNDRDYFYYERDGMRRFYYSDENDYDNDNYNYYRSHRYYYDNDYRDLEDEDYRDDLKDYDSRFSKRNSEGLFGNNVEDFNVYVRNKERSGGHFEVTFYFEDRDGNEVRASETKYIDGGRSAKFFYRDVYSERYDMEYLGYKVSSLN